MDSRGRHVFGGQGAFGHQIPPFLTERKRKPPPRVILSGAKRSRTAKQQRALAQLGSRGNIEMGLAPDFCLGKSEVAMQ